MSRVPKLRPLGSGRYAMWCPGCMTEHRFNVHDVNGDGKIVGWDGDTVEPTVPNVLRYDGCEFELRGGEMRFDLSCRHSLAGQKVPLPYFPLP